TTLAADPAALGLDLRLGEAATALDGGVLLTDRGEHAFDALVLATGSVPMGLPGIGGRRVLRPLDDASALPGAPSPRSPLAGGRAGGGGGRVDRRRARHHRPAARLPGHRRRGGGEPAGRGARARGGVGDGAVVRRGRGGPAAGPAGGVR